MAARDTGTDIMMFIVETELFRRSEICFGISLNDANDVVLGKYPILAKNGVIYGTTST